MYLSASFLERYPSNPNWPSILGQFVYLRTYSRFIEKLGRRETWKETVTRVVEYTIGLDTISEHHEKVTEAEQLFEYMFKLKVFPAGRTLWTGGTEAAKKYPLSNFNCSFTVIKDFEAFTDAFYLMMLGTGVGFRVLPEDVATLPRLRMRSLSVEHDTYYPTPKEHRNETTVSYKEVVRGVFTNVIIIGDSKEGWVDGLARLLEAFTDNSVAKVLINYNSVRPAGEVLKTFGGRASGHEALKNMYTKIADTLNEGILADRYTISTLQAMDIMNLIGEAVVVGGVRRSSEITLFDINDESVLTAKQDLWSDPSKQSKRFRSMSNNSVFFTRKPTKEQLVKIFDLISVNGEPGFINAEASAKRRKWYAGTNPCAEILLADKGVCNLSEVNVRAFVVQDPSGRNVIDIYDLHEAIQMATRIGVRMATLELELPKWNATQARDRLTGVSLTGYVEAMDAVGCDSTVSSSAVPDVTRRLEIDQPSYGYTYSLESFLYDLRLVANREAKSYATELRIAPPLLVTCVKPSGTIAQLPTVSSGAHASYAPYYIRRVRISSNDPLAKAMHSAKFTIFPEATHCDPAVFAALSESDKLDVLQRSATWVIEFPVKTSAVKPASDESALMQLSRYFILQREWADHNTSITINFSPDEVAGIVDCIYENWDDYIGVSFLPRFSTAYPLMPYEEINEEEYTRRQAQIAHIDGDYITKALSFYEHPVEIDEILDADCEGGACPIR